MANSVYEKVEVLLHDDSTVVLRPLVIKDLKQFMKMLEELSNSSEDADVKEIDDHVSNILINAAAFCLRRQRSEFWDDKKNEHTESFEEVIDMTTVHEVLRVCGGVDLNDPKLLEAAQEAVLQGAGKS